MTKSHEDILSAAMTLPAELRAELAERLLTSLDSPEQAGIDSAWAAEAERRIDQLDRGQTELLPGDAVMEQLRARCK